MEVEFGTIMEFIVLGAIAIELFALYNHSKLDHRIDEHILDTDRKLEKYDVMINVLSNNMSKLDEHMIRYDEHMSKLDEHMNRYDQSLNEHMNK
ncbi:hypothetical protein KAI11_04665, partial [Candidatus Bathyarchaeota archaeon]|nr:hypothetical protein [Candidatus Bathyarchaeota archaeon]